jgi:hypothetical protein
MRSQKLSVGRSLPHVPKRRWLFFHRNPPKSPSEVNELHFFLSVLHPILLPCTKFLTSLSFLILCFTAPRAVLDPGCVLGTCQCSRKHGLCRRPPCRWHPGGWCQCCCTRWPTCAATTASIRSYVGAVRHHVSTYLCVAKKNSDESACKSIPTLH